jgi:tRNA(Ile)-lysidine synthase
MNRSESLSIEQKVSDQIEEYFSDTPAFVVGVSGGADSMALLYTFKELEIPAFVVHVNYGLRGAESDKDQELVEGMSFEWGFECCSVKLDSEKMREGNFQNWAREERYRILKEFVNEVEVDGIAVAHHKGDQLETIIQKLFRGSSPETWTGMAEWKNQIFRPLLEFDKEEILKYCNDRAIPFRSDSSNLDSKYARNFLRNEFSKKMDELFVGWEENILKLKEFGVLNSKMLDQLSGDYFNDEQLFIEPLKGIDKILAQALIKKFLEHSEVYPSRGIIEQTYNLLSSQVGSELSISKSFMLVRERDSISRTNAHDEFEDLTISEREIENKFSSNELEFEISKKIDSELYLDADKIRFPLIVRRWKAGDKIQPFGMTGTQKISDHLTNRKVSPVKKEKSLVLTDSDGTIYAIIFKGKDSKSGTISELCKATDSTKRYLSITIKKQA